MDSLASAPVIGAAELRHRLRTPLNHLIGYSEILIEDYPEYANRVEMLMAEANLMLDALQQTAGGDQTSLPVAALTRLRHQTAGGIDRARRTVDDLRLSMPESAHSDLDRIAAAVSVLIDALSAGHVGATGTAPVPVSTAVRELRLAPVSGPGRILVVDDNELNRDMLSRQLERQHHEVSTAPDGPTALAMLRATRFDVVLLDLMMPGMNGFEVLQAVRGDAALAGVAVILVSALDEMESVVRCIEAGAEDYLFKPVNPTLLRARLKSTLDKLRADETVRRKQRLESIGLLAAGIAHDFNNLLTGIIGNAQLLEQVLGIPEDREMAASIIEAGERAAELTRQLLAYSGKAHAQMQSLDLAGLIRESEGLLRASVPKMMHFELRVNGLPPITADPNQIRQALLNLTLNAAEAIGPDCAGSVTIETGTEQIDGTHFDVMPDQPATGMFSWFEVRDTGCGMDQATVPKIFEPFFSTKFLGRGLGLAAVAGIVRSHRGFLRVKSAPGNGTAFRVFFPVAAAGETAPEPSEAGSYVLVVDDEPIVRQIVKVALERAGRKVLSADSGESAVEIFQRSSLRIGLVLLDWKMPVMDGSETLSRLRAIRPEVKVIVSSGFAQTEAEDRFRDSNITGYLQKPYKMSELTALVDKSL
jgi:DNA-binding response OmpR family regulator